jgi:ethanolamine permease
MKVDRMRILDPWFPGFALVASVICLIAMVYYNPVVAIIFAGLLLFGYLYFVLTATQRAAAPRDGQLEAADASPA